MKNAPPRGAQKLARGFGIASAAMLLLIGTGTTLFAATKPVDSVAPKTSAQVEAECSSNGAATLERSGATGAVRFVGAAEGQALRDTAGATAEESAMNYLNACASLFGVADPQSNLSVEKTSVQPDGQSMVRYQQRYNGVPVLAGELIVNMNAARSVTSVSGEALPNVQVDTNPQIEQAAAQNSAVDTLARQLGEDPSQLIVSEPTLWIYNPLLISPSAGPTQLVWRMEVTHQTKLELRELVLVDAHKGSVALAFNQVDFAKNRLTYDANNGTSLPGTLRCNEANPSCSGGDSHEVAAHVYAGDTYDFYKNHFGRDSIDNAGLTLKSTVHYSSGYQNAFWNGQQMVYGDAYGFPLGDDVDAHELTHGVTENESGLFYYYQSGAINESLSDVFGEFVDLTNGKGNDAAGVRWLLGEDISGLGAIRNMANPPAFGDPDKMTSPNYYTNLCISITSNCDNGGVHFNSGVNNKAAFLMTDGGNFNGKSVTGIGIDKAARIYYLVNTNYLTSGSDYGDLYNALYQACQSLIGTIGITSGDCQQVRNATDAVEMNSQPYAGYNADAPLCTSGSPSNLFFDNLENGANNWTFSGISGGINQWSLEGPSAYFYYAHSGTHFLYGDDYPSNGKPNTAASMNKSVQLPANAYLHFYHAYGFEDPNYDGGVLEYSTNGGSSWTDAGSLIQVNGYDGTLDSGNPLGARNAFLSDSHGYISTRVNLASLAGQSVRFRWHLGADQIGYDRGWFVDDVRIYTCGAGTGSVTVTAASVTNTKDISKSQYKAGSKIKFHAELNNSGAACNITLKWKASKDGFTIASEKQNTTANAGNSSQALKVTIPDNAPSNTYKLKVTSTCNGQKSSKSAKFNVVAK